MREVNFLQCGQVSFPELTHAASLSSDFSPPEPWEINSCLSHLGFVTCYNSSYLLASPTLYCLRMGQVHSFLGIHKGLRGNAWQMIRIYNKNVILVYLCVTFQNKELPMVPYLKHAFTQHFGQVNFNPLVNQTGSHSVGFWGNWCNQDWWHEFGLQWIENRVKPRKVLCTLRAWYYEPNIR